ncbi:MAG: hypothetical protein AAB880_00975, partial [Patescibacteria group bacterium]
FWPADSAGGKPNMAISRFYQKLNLISWDKVAWPANILPLLSGQIELASWPRVGGTDGGGVLLKTQLKDKAAWLSLFGLSAESYQGEVQTHEVAVSGLWNHLTKNPNKIAWQVLGNDLYLADNEKILFDLSKKNSNSLSKELKNIKVKPGLALFYAKDKDSLVLDNVYVKALTSAASYPLAIGFLEEQDMLKFNIYGQKLSTSDIPASDLADKLFYFNQAFYAHNLPLAYAQAEGKLPEALKNGFWAVLKDFYGIEKEKALTEFGASEIFFVFSGNDWLLNIADKTGENNNLTSLIKQSAAVLFATSHPVAREQRLADGTKMIELRAEVAGLEWAKEPWSYAGQVLNMESLRGQGEASGYYAGFVPEIGYILTTAMPLLNTYASQGANDQDKTKQKFCYPKKNIVMAAAIEKIIIFALGDGKISGCAVLPE